MKKFKLIAVLSLLFCGAALSAQDFDWSECWCNYGGGIKQGDIIVNAAGGLWYGDFAYAAYNDYYKGNDTNKTYLRPLGAFFVDNDANASTIQRVISIEEPNGTTEISAITVDGAFVEADGWYTTNGIRLQGVPTEKGVYIRNGKKIVIK